MSCFEFRYHCLGCQGLPEPWGSAVWFSLLWPPGDVVAQKLTGTDAPGANLHQTDYLRPQHLLRSV